MQFLNFKRQISCSPYADEKSSMKLTTFVQHTQNQQDSLCEDRSEAYQYPAPLQLCSNVEDHRSLLATRSVTVTARNVNTRRQQTTQTSVFLVRQFDRFNVSLIEKWKILVLVIADPPKASERLNFDTKNSKYRILQMRKLHRRLNFTMQPSPTKSRNKRSKAMRIR
jgi:hypothetical protein